MATRFRGRGSSPATAGGAYGALGVDARLHQQQHRVSVWRIRDVYPGSGIRIFSIPDPGSASKNLSILTQRKTKKWVLSSRKYDPGCSSRIPDKGADFLPIPDPGSRGQKGTGSRISDPGSRIPDPDPQHWLSKPWIRIRVHLKCWIRIRIQFNVSGSTTLLEECSR